MAATGSKHSMPLGAGLKTGSKTKFILGIFLSFILLTSPDLTSARLTGGKDKVKEKGLAACLKHLPKQVPAHLREYLCSEGSNGEVPAQCAKMMMKVRSSNAFAPEELTEFCRSSNTHSINCMKRLITSPSKFSNKAKVDVCKYSAENSRNLDCVQGIKVPRSYPTDFPATFCSSVSPPPASIACANEASKKLKAEETILLCQGEGQRAEINSVACI